MANTKKKSTLRRSSYRKLITPWNRSPIGGRFRMEVEPLQCPVLIACLRNGRAFYSRSTDNRSVGDRRGQARRWAKEDNGEKKNFWRMTMKVVDILVIYIPGAVAENMGTEFLLIRLLTGHWSFTTNIFRMGLNDSPLCEYCPDKTGDAQHDKIDKEKMLRSKTSYCKI